MATSIKKCFVHCVWALGLVIPVMAQAQEIPPPAYQLAALNEGVPSEVLYAVALTESGLRIERKVIPWPWTLNVAGKGRFFRTREDACTALTEVLKTVSAKRVDVGLGQVNYGYHGERVNHACDLLDPYLNLSIAATILKEQHRAGQDWLMTIGRYHSPANGDRAAIYRNAANRHLSRITARSPQSVPATKPQSMAIMDANTVATTVAQVEEPVPLPIQTLIPVTPNLPSTR